MTTNIQVSAETYRLLQRHAREMQTTPEQVADTAIRLQLGNTIHIEQKSTSHGPQAYVRGTRVAVRHIVDFLQAGYTAEEIIQTGLPHIPPAAIYEALAYYYDHQQEIQSELKANDPQTIYKNLQTLLTEEQYTSLTGQSA